jgi:hypothetical protein
LIALTNNPAVSIYRYSPGPPDRVAYDDYSDQLRELLP